MLQRTTLLLALVLALAQTGCRPASPTFDCTDAIGCVDIEPDAPVKIGAIQNMTGEGPPGLGLLRCAELALEDRGGQILGHPVEIQVADAKCSGEGGTTAALKIAADPQIVGIVGPSCSGEAVTAMKVTSEAGLVMISGSSTAPSLTSVGGQPGRDWQPGFFRTAQNDALAGRAAAIFAFEELGTRKAGTINAGDAYTRGLTDTFRQAYGEFGGQIVLDAAVNRGDTDMQPVLNAIAASGAELLFFPVYEPEGNHLVLQAADIEPFKEIIFLSAEGLYFDTFIFDVGEAGIGMFFVAPAVSEGPSYDAFVSRFRDKFQEPPIAVYNTTTYDAANLLMDAVEAVAVQEKDGALRIGRQALRDALHATAGYEGLSGNLTCDAYGDCGVARFKVTRLDDPAAGVQGLNSNVVYTYSPDQ